MTLSLVGWINGITISFIFFFTIIFGFFSFYQAKKSKAKLLYYFSSAIICAGLVWVGNFIDFLTIVFTGKNVDNSYGFVGILCEIWFAPAYIIAMILAIEILKPKRKKYIISILIVVGILYEIFLIIDPIGSITYIYPSTPGEDLIEDNIVLTSPAGVLFLILLFSFVIFDGFGILIKAIQLKGILRKKFLLFSTASFLIIIVGFLDNLLSPGIFLMFIRFILILCYFLWYFSLREEPEKKILPKKEIKVEDDLFRISHFERGEITEEEVSVYRDQAICLVCKGQVLRYSYICPNCKALYCANCARSLSDLENVCWVCDTPFDESKPSKPFKKEDEAIDLEISEKITKTPKIDKYSH